MTRCLAVALGPEVTVSCVPPGLMDGTRMTSTRLEVVADLVVAFCRSDSVTGQVLNIDVGVFFH